MFQTKLKRKSKQKFHVSKDFSGWFSNLRWPFGNCKKGRHILLFHNRWRWHMVPAIWPANIKTKSRADRYKQTHLPLTQPSKTKTMLIASFDCRGAVHKKFVTQGQTVNQNVYKVVLQRLHESIRRRPSGLWATGKWFLLHDNARQHKALSVKEFLSVRQIRSLYFTCAIFPRFVTLLFVLFPRLKRALKRHG